MKVSVLVPVYGVEKYIARCAESLFGQTFKDIEYIFVDDCTRDRSMEVLQEVLDRYPERKEHVRIIKQEHNRGVGAARQRGLDEAKTPYVMFVDSDDYMPVDAVEKLYNRIVETDTDIVDGSYQEVSHDKVLRTVHPVTYGSIAYVKILLCHNILSNQLWGRLYKRSLFTGAHLSFAEGVDYGEDFYMVTRLLANGSRSWINDVVYCYRNDNNSSYTNNLSEKNVLSGLKSCYEVSDYFLTEVVGLDYIFTLNFNMIHGLRLARENGLDMNSIKWFYSSYQPDHWIFVMLKKMFLSKRIPVQISVFLLKVVRRIYLWQIRKS